MIIAKEPPSLRTAGPRGSPTRSSILPNLRVQGPPTARRSRVPAPVARAARRATARGGCEPKYHAGPALNRINALPSVRKRAATGARGVIIHPAAKVKTAPTANAELARRLGQATIAPNRIIHAAISVPVQGRRSTAAPGIAAALTHVLSKIHSPAPTRRAATGTNHGHQASAAHTINPPASKGPDNGTRIMLTTGPTSDTRPNTPVQRGHKAAATAKPVKNRIAIVRAGPGQDEGTTFSTAGPAHRMAAQAPTLINALGDRAEAGLSASMTAAASVNAAPAVVSRPATRATIMAANMTHARTHGGSAPAISV
mgnify:CR=1 FL=1